MPYCALAAGGRGGQAGVRPEPAVADFCANPAEQFDILWSRQRHGLKELQRSKRWRTKSTTWFPCCSSPSRTRPVRREFRRQDPPAGGARRPGTVAARIRHALHERERRPRTMERWASDSHGTLRVGPAADGQAHSCRLRRRWRSEAGFLVLGATADVLAVSMGMRVGDGSHPQRRRNSRCSCLVVPCPREGSCFLPRPPAV